MKTKKNNGTIQITLTAEQYCTVKTALLLELERNQRTDNDARAEEIVAMLKDAFGAICGAL
ncbi:MAG: hypothetical protein J6S14_11850 [Clostridia bacterium]|nr:hypothetical protein [Clostridia bacterium]